MLEGVGTVALRSGGGGTWPHTANRLDGTRSRLERKHEILNINDEIKMQNSKITGVNGGDTAEHKLLFRLMVDGDFKVNINWTPQPTILS